MTAGCLVVQVSVSDESGSNPRAALGNSNGAGGDSIYKDYDDGDEEEEDEDQLLLAQQQQQEREDEEEEERARYGVSTASPRLSCLTRCGR